MTEFINSSTANGEQPRSSMGGLAGLCLTILLSSLATSVANVSLPTLSEFFAAPFQSVQWVMIASLLVVTTFIVSVGRLGDMTGRRRLLLIGIVLFSVASTLCGVSPTLSLLIGSRALQGLGAAIMLALAMAFVGDIVPKEGIGSAMGLLATMSSAGTALGPSLGGVMIAFTGWRSIFLINLPLGLLAFWFAYRYLPADQGVGDRQPARFDILGTILLGITLASYALAMTVGRGTLGHLNLILLAAAVLAGIVFLITESRVRSPLISLSMFRDIDLSASLISAVLVSTLLMATLFVGPFYLSHGLGLNTAHVGLVMSIGPLVVAVTGIPAGRVADRFGALPMATVGLGGILAGSISYIFTSPAFGISGYLAPVTFITCGYGLFQTANNTLVMTDVPSDRRGLVSGLLNLARNLGAISGASAMGALFASAAGSMQNPTSDEIADGMHATYAVGFGLMILAIGVLLGARQISRKGNRNREVT